MVADTGYPKSRVGAILGPVSRIIPSAVLGRHTSKHLCVASVPYCYQAGLVDSEGHLVGEVDGQGFGIGVAPFSSKPGKRSKAKKGKDQIRLVWSCFLSHLSPASLPLQDFLYFFGGGAWLPKTFLIAQQFLLPFQLSTFPPPQTVP